jgi:hypothetical protein
MYGGLFFLKDFYMKSVIKVAGEKEMVEGGLFTMAEIEKALNIVSGNQKIEENEKE